MKNWNYLNLFQMTPLRGPSHGEPWTPPSYGAEGGTGFQGHKTLRPVSGNYFI